MKRHSIMLLAATLALTACATAEGYRHRKDTEFRHQIGHDIRCY